jgi:hypothetical protein
MTSTKESRRADLAACRAELSRSRRRLLFYRQLHLLDPAGVETNLQAKLAETISALKRGCRSR